MSAFYLKHTSSYKSLSSEAYYGPVPEFGFSAKEMKPRANTCEDIDIEPKTGAPFFHVNLTKTHVSPLYLLTIPAEGARLLPNIEAPVILTRGTESWTMNYIGNNIVHKRLDKRWKQFAVDNKLKVGDVCTFELTSKDPMRLKVQVLRVL
uniref:TF-B3 domain-containing protein n=1 Tax=Chenopodium quinoa TaxID=63459 RepID=A0A803ML09_CHEQI